MLETGLLSGDSLHEGRVGTELESQRGDEQLRLCRGRMATVQQSVFVQPRRVEHGGADALDLGAGGDAGDITRRFGRRATRARLRRAQQEELADRDERIITHGVGLAQSRR